MANFLDFLFGKGEKTEQFQRYTPEQENVLNQLLGGGGQQLPQAFDFLQGILSQDPERMKQFEAPAMRQFEEEIIPTIAERFTGADAQKSSAFGQQLGKAGAGLSERLAAQRGGMGMDALSKLQSLLSGGLGQRFETAIRPGQPGLAQAGIGGLGQLLPLLLGL